MIIVSISLPGLYSGTSSVVVVVIRFLAMQFCGQERVHGDHPGGVPSRVLVRRAERALVRRALAVVAAKYAWHASYC